MGIWMTAARQPAQCGRCESVVSFCAKARPMRFDLVDLRLFDAVVRAGSISKGAEAAAPGSRLGQRPHQRHGGDARGCAAGARAPRRHAHGGGARAAVHARSITGQVERMRGDLRLFSSGFKGEIRMMSNTAGARRHRPACAEGLPRRPSRGGHRHRGADERRDRHGGGGRARSSSASWRPAPTRAPWRRGRWRSTG